MQPLIESWLRRLIKCLREGYDGRMNAALKRKLTEEAECYEYLISHVVVNGEIWEDIKLVKA